jgi:hypothetical protein
MACLIRKEKGGVKKNVELVVGNARRSVPSLPRSTELKWFYHSTRNGTASVPYGALNSFTFSKGRK